jgi:hypothetical protein
MLVFLLFSRVLDSRMQGVLVYGIARLDRGLFVRKAQD